MLSSSVGEITYPFLKFNGEITYPLRKFNGATGEV